MKTRRIELLSIIMAAAVIISGCGGKNGVSPVSVAPTGNMSAMVDNNGNTPATNTVSPQVAANYVGIPAPSGRVAAVIPNTTQLVISPSAKGMSFSGACGADYGGRGGSVVNQIIWLSAAAVPCWGLSGLVEFDLAPLDYVAVSDIALVELRLYAYLAFGQPGSAWLYNFEVAAYPNKSAWSEDTAWHYNQPAYDTGFADNKITLTSDLGWKTWVVTDIVQKWASGNMKNYGFHLVPLNSGAPEDSNVQMYDEVSGSAQTPSLAPQLIVYVKDPVPVDLNGDGVPDTIDTCPAGTPAAGVDADLNGCPDTILGLRILLQNMIATNSTYRTLNRTAKSADAAIQAGNTAKAIKILDKMTKTIIAEKRVSLPPATADMLVQYIKNISDALVAGPSTKKPSKKQSQT